MEKDYLSACASGNITLLVEKVNPNCLDPDGRGALHLVCRRPKMDTMRIIQILIEGGVDVDLVDSNNLTALDYLLFWDHFDPQLASYVLDNSIGGINRQDPNGLSYLYSAKTVEAAKFLVERGIDINSVDKDGNTFLQWSSPTDPIHM